MENRLAALTRYASLVLLGCSGTDDAGAIRTQQGQFEALTYNVAGLPQGISGSNPETNIPQISPLLNAYDLVLVQEDFSYHEELARDALHPYQSLPKQQFDTLVNDGLNRFSQFVWSRFARVQWVACYGSATTGAGDCLAEKGFSLARTQLGEGALVDVYNHHAEAGGGPEDVAAREAGFDQLIAFIVAESAGNAVIVGGDTNLNGDDTEDRELLDRFLLQTGLRDACAELGCGDDRIDRFFFRDSDLLHVEPVAWRVGDEFVDGEGQDLSDHRAVHVRFAWNTR